MKHNVARRPRTPLAIAVLAVLVLATGCARISQPTGWASPVTDGSTVIAQTDDGVVSAFRISNSDSPASVEQSWSYPPEDSEVDFQTIYANPIIDGGTVYIAGYNGTIAALEVSTLNPISAWGGPIELDENIVATPVLSGGTLYVATELGSLIAIDVANGSRTVLAQISDRIWGAPAADGSRLYVGALDDKLRAVDRVTGALEWTREVGTVAGDLLIDRDLLLVGSFDRKLHALDLTSDGAERWAAAGDGWFWARPLVVGDTVYAATVNGSVYAFSRTDGSERWRFQRDNTEIRTAPVLVDGVLLLASRDGHIYGINPSSGAEMWTRELEGERFLADPLVLESSIVVFADDSGDLLQVTPSSGDVRPLFERG